MQLINRTVKDFLNELASGAPTPGGGSAGALAGALAAGLVSMVANLTVGHPRYVQVDAPLREVLAESERLRRLLMELVDADAAAYRAVTDARHRPQQTETDRQMREAEVQSALRQATDVPLCTAQACRQTLDLCSRVAEMGNQNAISDVGTAAELADAGLRSAELNARINIRFIQDSDYTHHAQRQLRACLEGADARREEVLAAVRSRIG